MLTIPLEKLAFIIEKARAFDAEVDPVDENSGSNAADDGERAILQDTPDNPVLEELTNVLDDLNVDEQDEVLALLWVGRGDFGKKEWRDALRQAHETRNNRETRYLVGTPLLADYLSQGLEELGYSLEGAAEA
ncbi:MAG TPA: DUF3775 domain-containing protein [Candidatus Sulfotelmatobacter sp.]|nr:DUF3775 domain-containing protein [Candidatus Sulfotelmatobacter sp.]